MWKSDLRVLGFAGDRARIPGMTDPVDDGQKLTFEGMRVEIIFIPAHTNGHVAYYLPNEAAVFTGDTLFAGGCGRLFEGDARMMVGSLSRLTALPPGTRIYCGHEYTEKNLRFALSLEPGNHELSEKHARVKVQYERGEPTVPTTVAEELATNPFLRSGSPELRRSVLAKFPDCSDDPVAIFAKTRELKDSF